MRIFYLKYDTEYDNLLSYLTHGIAKVLAQIA